MHRFVLVLLCECIFCTFKVFVVFFFRWFWSGLTDSFQLSWWDASKLHCQEMWHVSASEWNYGAYKNVLHCCHGSRVGLLLSSHMGDWVVPWSGKVQKRLSVNLHLWPSFSAISTCTAPTKAYFHRILLNKIPLYPNAVLPLSSWTTVLDL